MKARFDGKVALVTGGGTGIGAATARRLASEGARVLVTGRRPEPIDRVAAEIGGLAVAGDTSDDAHIAEAVAAAVDRFGGLDILVANAGWSVNGSVEDVTLEDFRRAFAVNLEGALLAARRSIPEMRRRGGGSIVLVSSMAAFVGAPNYVGYLSSKTAMLGLNRSLAYDYGPENIRSNVVCPGWARSEMTDAALEMFAGRKGCTVDELIAQVVKSSPLRRMASPAEIAATIAFLASNDASFVTGTVLIADGGVAIVDASTTVFSDS